MPANFPPPWKATFASEECVRVEDANGWPIAFIYFRDGPGIIGTDSSERMTRDQARRIGANIAKLPDLLLKP